MSFQYVNQRPAAVNSPLWLTSAAPPPEERPEESDIWINQGTGRLGSLAEAEAGGSWSALWKIDPTLIEEMIVECALAYVEDRRMDVIVIDEDGNAKGRNRVSAGDAMQVLDVVASVLKIRPPSSYVEELEYKLDEDTGEVRMHSADDDGNPSCGVEGCPCGPGRYEFAARLAASVKRHSVILDRLRSTKPEQT